MENEKKDEGDTKANMEQEEEETNKLVKFKHVLFIYLFL